MNVGELRKALEDLPHDRPIFCQVVAADDRAWSMNFEFLGCVRHGTIALITVSHPDLKTLPTIEETEAKP